MKRAVITAVTFLLTFAVCLGLAYMYGIDFYLRNKEAGTVITFSLFCGLAAAFIVFTSPYEGESK